MKIVATIYKKEDTPIGFEQNRFSGCFYEEDVPQDRIIIDRLPLNDLVINIWDEKEKKWIEGMKKENLEHYKKTEILSRLNFSIRKLHTYILAMSIGKPPDDNLEYYSVAYTNKYNICKSFKDNNVLLDDLLVKESELEGFRNINEYIDFVIFKFDQGKALLDRGVQIIEFFRKQIYADLSANNYDVASQRLKIIEDLPADVKSEQVDIIYNKISTNLLT
ncbi:hypothetical protein BWK60_01920 [Flavobacterium covae]|uniref:hypothetical protein n=1 Tax=Flavobacterium covae TaxID=2906076 RepID=UPI000B4D6715|nr:hypothetical protein [Flavobacterium covae]OWP87770.1 hypothetical protein BWK60_01920 [Flavobacterium covae]